MARYSRRSTRRSTGRRSARGSNRGRSGGYSTARASRTRGVSRRRSTSSIRTRGSRPQTLRIVIDQSPPALTGIPIRNEAGQLMRAAPVRKARF